MNPYNFIFEKLTYNYNSLSITDFTLNVTSTVGQGKILLTNSSLSLNYKEVYGLIGKNGYGKSSLLKQFNNICNDEKIKILYVEQELILDTRTPVQFILDSNIKLTYYQNKVNLLNDEIQNDTGDFNQGLYSCLEEAENNLNLYNPDKEIALIKKILFGLGFNSAMLEQESCIFSGGWQMRISLARALYLEPDLLLLDEPTNHLDLEAIIWLSNYLESWKKMAIVVSHNIGFLNTVCSYILNIENKELISYKGNYDKFKSAFNKKLLEQKKQYEKFDKQIKTLKKKGNKKELENILKKNTINRPEKDYNVSMDFLPINKYNQNIIRIENVSFSYDKTLILDNISLGLDMNSKVTLVGLNGCGKSTLLKLIMNELTPSEGYISIQNNIRIGYYNQHFDQQLPFNKTPVEFLINLVPRELEVSLNLNKYDIVRNYLGKIKLESSAHEKQISELSGGQKARVAFVKLIFQMPHFILLDEPTNHLDIETVEILIESLENFTGGILLITHEPELINKLDTRIWLLNNHKINYNIESFDKYCDTILASQL